MLESIQYAVLYLLSAFFTGVFLDFQFPTYDESKPTGVVFREVLRQCLALVLVVILVRTCVKSVPILFPVGTPTRYVPYKTAEFNGEMMMGLVFLSSQMNLVYKIDLLATRLYTLLYNKERKLLRRRG